MLKELKDSEKEIRKKREKEIPKKRVFSLTDRSYFNIIIELFMDDSLTMSAQKKLCGY